MLPIQELEYSAFRHTLAGLEEEFELRGEQADIFGSAIAGISIENLGQTNLFLMAAGFAAAAAPLMALLPVFHPSPAPAQFTACA